MGYNGNIELDKEKYKRLIIRIFQEEQKNFKTKKLKQNEMIDKIRKIIESVVGKDDN